MPELEINYLLFTIFIFTILQYQPINICLYWRIYNCMYRLEYIYQCKRINPTVLGKECKNKMYLES
jgi:hypothetical protein